MNVTVKPSHLCGAVAAPPSKSMAHRLLIAAGLAHGQSSITGIADSQDVLATLDLLAGLGAHFEKNCGQVEIRGMDPRNAAPVQPLSCRECGSTLRFFIPICLLSSNPVTLTGSGRLFARPLTVYEEICRQRGLRWEQSDASVTLQGPLRGGEFTIPGNVSSQFISGLLFALPLCEEDSVIRILPPLESKPYVDMTVASLRRFGITVLWEEELTIRIPGKQQYLSQSFAVEGDYSNAAFFDGLRLLGHDVSVTGLQEESLQGDRIYRSYFSALEEGNPTLSLRQCPDLGPILMALAAAGKGATLTDTERLRIKESDRGVVMAQELGDIL